VAALSTALLASNEGLADAVAADLTVENRAFLIVRSRHQVQPEGAGIDLEGRALEKFRELSVETSFEPGVGVGLAGEIGLLELSGRGARC